MRFGGLSLTRYVTYEANADSTSPCGQLPVSLESGNGVTSVPASTEPIETSLEYSDASLRSTPTKSGGAHDMEHSTVALSSPHLSGSDPRMFPGILAKEHRNDSFRVLGQADARSTTEFL